MTVAEQVGPDVPKSDARRVPGEEGIWVLVLGDMTVFALFFGTFMYSRHKNADQFALAHTSLSTSLGTVNTVLLLTSSLMVALGVARVLAGTRATVVKLFAGALCCGVGFVVVKGVEWSHLFAAGKGVGSGEYFSYYFMFTGIHLAHVVIGLIVLARMIVVTSKAEIGMKQRRFCESAGIYWHLVDLLWIVLFALFYLVK